MAVGMLERKGRLGTLVLTVAGLSYLLRRNRQVGRHWGGRIGRGGTVAEIMTHEPRCCLRSTPVVEIGRMMVESDCGEIPVVDSYENGKPVGVVTDRDIVCRLVAQRINPLEMRAEHCMSSPVVTVHVDSPARECVRLMEENRIRRVPVVDSQGRVRGIVSQSDITRFLSRREGVEGVRGISRPSRAPARVAA